jgi:hypothetical protein
VAAPGAVPPGVSGANQYTETLPGAGGNEPTSNLHEKGQGPSAKTPAQALGHKNAAQLEALGPEGRAAAQLAAAGTPPRAPGGKASERTAHSGGSSAIGQVLGQLTGTSGSEGMGLLLPLLIAAGILAAAAYAFGRRRTAAGHD